MGRFDDDDRGSYRSIYSDPVWDRENKLDDMFSRDPSDLWRDDVYGNNTSSSSGSSWEEER